MAAAADEAGVTLSGRISRQPNVKYGVAALFVVSAASAPLTLPILGASSAATLAMVLLLLATAVPVALAPTATMDRRWFQLLPLAITVESGIGMWMVAPDAGPVASLFIFNGALAVFLAMTWRGAVPHLLLATVVMVSPVVAGRSATESTVMVLGAILVMWGFAAMTMMTWRHAEDAAAQLDELAQRDPLTGLGNRRMLDERLEYELVRHMRSGERLTLVAIDLNGFKAINDSLGHAVGDDALRDVALALAGAVRAQDTVARPGGDEFCVIAPDTGREAADVLIAHIHAALAGVSAGGMAVKAAIGSAVFPDDALRARALFEAADAAQLRDKPRVEARAGAHHPD